MDEFKVEVFEVSLGDKVIAAVPFGGLEPFINCVLKSNDSVCISKGFILR